MNCHVGAYNYHSLHTSQMTKTTLMTYDFQKKKRFSFNTKNPSPNTIFTKLQKYINTKRKRKKSKVLIYCDVWCSPRKF
jgi:hypothetical protein